MRTIIEDREKNMYDSAYEILSKKIKEEVKKEDIDNRIISYEDLVSHTAELLHDNFLTSSQEEDLYEINASYETHSLDILKANGDTKIDNIYAFADKLIPSFNKEGNDNIYETAIERFEEVEGLAKVVLHTVIQYSDDMSFDKFNNIGRTESETGFEGMGFAYGSVAGDNVVGSLESYGLTEQNHKADMRAAVMINSDNYLTSLNDRMFERISTPTAKTTFETENIVKFDYAKGKDKSATVRNSDVELSYVELHKDPSSINTKSMPVEFKDSSDQHTFENGKLLKIGHEFNIFDITRDNTKVGFDHAGESDRLSEGGKVKNIYVQIQTNTNTSRVYKVDVRFNDGSWFTKAENMKDGAERVVQFTLKNYPIINTHSIAEHRGSAQNDDNDDADQLADIIGGKGEQAIAINCTVTGKLNLRDGQIQISSSDKLSWDVIDVDTGKTTIDTDALTIKTAIAASTGKIDIVAYDIDLQFTEENIRKATVGIRKNVITKSAKVPHGKTYIFETQAAPAQTNLESLITTSKNIIGLGNVDKSLTIVEDFIDNGVEALKIADMQPNSTTYDNFNSNFVSSNRVLPSIKKKIINFQTFSNRRELEKTHDAYGLLERELKSLVSKMDEESVYSNVLNTGEKLRFTAVTHNRIINTIISPMTPNAETKKPSRNGMHKATIQISQNCIIEFHGVSFDSYANKVLMFPIRQSNRGDTTSFGCNLDVGTFLGNFISGGSGVSRKHIANSREILFITTPVAAKLVFENISTVYPDIT